MSKSQSAAPEGSPTHSPKIRIRGVQSDSPRYAELVDQYRARLGAFHERHQQQVRISGNPQYSAKVAWPGARAVYHNNNGQETVTLIVDSVEEGSEEQQKVADFWDWALIEVELPDMTQSEDGLFAAIMDRKGKDPSWAVDGWFDNSDDKLLRFADSAWEKQLNDETDTTSLFSSLLVDLRQFKHPGSINLDLHGFVFPINITGLPDDDSKYRITGSSSAYTMQRDDGGLQLANDPTSWPAGGFYTITASADDYAKLQTLFPEYAYPRRDPAVGGSSGVFSYSPLWNSTTDPLHSFPDAWSAIQQHTYPEAAPDPNTYMSTFAAARASTSVNWSDSFGTTAFARVSTEEGCTWAAPGEPSEGHTTNSIPGPFVTGQYFTHMYDYKLLYIPLCTVYKARPAKVRAIFFKGGSPDASSYGIVRDGGHFQADYYRWESSKIYPNRWNMPQPLPGSDFSVPSQDYPSDTSLGNKFGMPLLGKLTINPSVEQGGFKFVPA